MLSKTEVEAAIASGFTIVREAGKFHLYSLEKQLLGEAHPDDIRTLRHAKVIAPKRYGSIYKAYATVKEEAERTRIQKEQATQVKAHSHNALSPRITKTHNMINFIEDSLADIEYVEAIEPKGPRYVKARMTFAEMRKIYKKWYRLTGGYARHGEEIGRNVLYKSLVETGLDIQRYHGAWYFIGVVPKLIPQG